MLWWIEQWLSCRKGNYWRRTLSLSLSLSLSLYIYIYIYIHTYIHTYTHTHTILCLLSDCNLLIHLMIFWSSDVRCWFKKGSVLSEMSRSWLQRLLYLQWTVRRLFWFTILHSLLTCLLINGNRLPIFPATNSSWCVLQFLSCYWFIWNVGW